MTERLLYTLRHAAELVDRSPKTLERAIASTGAEGSLPPLAAKRHGREILIPHAALVAWAESLPDA